MSFAQYVGEDYTHLVSETKPAERAMWALWRDFFIPTQSWRMKTPIGVMSFKTRRAALAANADPQHPYRKHWEQLRVAIAKAEGR